MKSASKMAGPAGHEAQGGQGGAQAQAAALSQLQMGCPAARRRGPRRVLRAAARRPSGKRPLTDPRRSRRGLAAVAPYGYPPLARTRLEARLPARSIPRRSPPHRPAPTSPRTRRSVRVRVVPRRGAPAPGHPTGTIPWPSSCASVARAPPSVRSTASSRPTRARRATAGSSRSSASTTRSRTPRRSRSTTSAPCTGSSTAPSRPRQVEKLLRISVSGSSSSPTTSPSATGRPARTSSAVEEGPRQGRRG
jgi:hypothetical protein